MVTKEIRCLSGNDCANTAGCACENCGKYWDAMAGEPKAKVVPEQKTVETKEKERCKT